MATEQYGTAQHLAQHLKWGAIQAGRIVTACCAKSFIRLRLQTHADGHRPDIALATAMAGDVCSMSASSDATSPWHAMTQNYIIRCVFAYTGTGPRPRSCVAIAGQCAVSRLKSSRRADVSRRLRLSVRPLRNAPSLIDGPSGPCSARPRNTRTRRGVPLNAPSSHLLRPFVLCGAFL